MQLNRKMISCELLTKFIIFAIGNNTHKNSILGRRVVNCLQNLLSLRSETTVWQNRNFAFMVVNCLQNLLSLRSETTVVTVIYNGFPL